MAVTFDLRLGDCVGADGLATVADASVDAMVTDPPSGTGFMGKDWDSDKGGRVSWVAWLESVMREALRVLKPGAHGLVWALPRTSHWTATALEQAGFEVRDVITHHFGTGFPKSLNISKALDEAAGATREVVGPKVYADGTPGHWSASEKFAQDGHTKSLDGVGKIETAPATEAAKQWDGWGTALKPASEHWILVRKPLAGTVAANVQAHGTGGLNVEGCRIDFKDAKDAKEKNRHGDFGDGPRRDNAVYGEDKRERTNYEAPGRWPANLVLSHAEWCDDGTCLPGCPVALLDAQSGTLKSGALDTGSISGRRYQPGDQTYDERRRATTREYAADTGGASRFFYVSKPTTAEREADLGLLPRRSAAELVDREAGSAGMKNPRAGAGRTSKGRANIHPTVKSTVLMSWLIRLVTPPGGLVLDPFTGSGSTGVAALRGGFRFLGWEQDPDHHRVAIARIGAAVDGPLFARAVAR